MSTQHFALQRPYALHNCHPGENIHVFIMDAGISKESVPIRVKMFRIKVISQNNCV